MSKRALLGIVMICVGVGFLARGGEDSGWAGTPRYPGIRLLGKIRGILLVDPDIQQEGTPPGERVQAMKMKLETIKRHSFDFGPTWSGVKAICGEIRKQAEEE